MLDWIMKKITNHEQKLQISKDIQNKINSFLKKYFPNKKGMKIEKKDFKKISLEFSEIEKMVLGLNVIGYFQEKHLKHTLSNLSAYYFENLPYTKNDVMFSKKGVSEIINGLKNVEHITIHALERKHKDTNHALKGINLHTRYIYETYFESDDKVNSMRMMDLKSDFNILLKKVQHFKEITQKLPEFNLIKSRFENLMHSLELLIFKWVRKEGIHYVHDDLKDIREKLKTLLEITKT
ncbi:hypothetical protein KY321_05465 [Candidatus Woesearchaeota archaeon]|nr:hypothetical protein [Candidatus Woesearchaeota archaeon]